ncbi:MAG: Maf family protein [Fusobacteriaceae bacterium]|nr:Maf family protein [Fusobacteriaceae bacterium]
MILASKSPRRKEILENAGFKLEIIVSDDDEKSDKIDIRSKILEIAKNKVQSIALKYPNRYVLGADTVVILDEMIIGKPYDEPDAIKTLEKLSGRKHTVLTGFSFINVSKNIDVSDYEMTQVFFRYIDDRIIKWYVSTGEPMDKAGSYGIQGKGSILIDRIDGDFFNVMGFPIAKFIKKLEKIGIKIDDIDKL